MTDADLQKLLHDPPEHLRPLALQLRSTLASLQQKQVRLATLQGEVLELRGGVKALKLALEAAAGENPAVTRHPAATQDVPADPDQPEVQPPPVSASGKA